MIERVMSQPIRAIKPTIAWIPTKLPAVSYIREPPLQQQQIRQIKQMIEAIDMNTTVYQSKAADAVCAVDAVFVEANC
jgi:hypothetical protein